jgi:hypothetical protein
MPTVEPISAVRKQIYNSLMPWQTRLLELLPTDQDQQVMECRLYVADLVAMEGLVLHDEQRLVTYDAISYSWGRPDLTASIRCNETTLPVPPALEEALRAIRTQSSLEDSLWLWCDATCINQGDLTEKALQVRMMLTIFQKAQKVVAWLGEPESASIRKVSPWNIQSPGPLTCLFEHAWFQRTWIRQEVFAARKLIMQHGHHRIDFEEVMELADELQRLGGLSGMLGSRINSLQRTYHSGALGQTGMGLTFQFYDVLREGPFFGCTDNRDRVYGVLGMVEGLRNRGNQLQPFPVDYTKTTAEVYGDVTRYLIHEIGSLDCLHLFGTRDSLNIPSWTFDFSQHCYREMSFMFFCENLDEQSYRAAATSSGTTSPLGSNRRQSGVARSKNTAFVWTTIF